MIGKKIISLVGIGISIVVFLMVFVNAIQVSEPSVTTPQNTNASIDEYIQQCDFSGIVLVADQNNVVFKKSYGYIDLESHKKIDENTVFLIGSLTKQFTAMAIVILEEKGVLDLDDPISHYVQNVPNGDEATLHDLLTHNSGIPDYFSNSMYNTQQKYSQEDILKVIRTQKSSYEPGEKYSYSNSNYFLLGLVIEKVSGIPYGEFIETNIFKPLNMTNSHYGSEKKEVENAFSAGALVSTAQDLYLWNQSLYSDRLVSKSAIEKIFTPYKGNYGYGWKVLKTGNDTTAMHLGYIKGFSSYIYRDLSNQHFIVILSNQENSNLPAQIAQYIRGIAFK